MLQLFISRFHLLISGFHLFIVALFHLSIFQCFKNEHAGHVSLFLDVKIKSQPFVASNGQSIDSRVSLLAATTIPVSVPKLLANLAAITKTPYKVSCSLLMLHSLLGMHAAACWCYESFHCDRPLALATMQLSLSRYLLGTVV